MTTNRPFAILVVALAGWLGLPAGAQSPAPAAVPVEFDYAGTYRLVKRVKLRSGKLPLVRRPSASRVRV